MSIKLALIGFVFAGFAGLIIAVTYFQKSLYINSANRRLALFFYLYFFRHGFTLIPLAQVKTGIPFCHSRENGNPLKTPST